MMSGPGASEGFRCFTTGWENPSLAHRAGMSENLRQPPGKTLAAGVLHRKTPATQDANSIDAAERSNKRRLTRLRHHRAGHGAPLEVLGEGVELRLHRLVPGQGL